MASVLVTGGAGYVGSHTLRALIGRGERVVVLDNLSEGHTAALSGAELIRADLTDAIEGAEILDRLFRRERFDAVLHFAGRAYVGESMQDPARYYKTNVGGGVDLVSAMVRHDVPAIIFSSTCATYGEPRELPIDEKHPQRPVNCYGRTKLAFEGVLEDFEKAHGLRHINLRYFNAAGAHPKGDLGEDHRPETHLIPLLAHVALGQRPSISVFGNDYPTNDGTCIRDFVHVMDLASAHCLALDALRKGAPSTSYNVGTGQGYSVLEVVESMKRVSGNDVGVEFSPRRPGDPARLVASNEKIVSELGWKPEFTSIDAVVETAWGFHYNHPGGYGQG